jgi:hypothetical protein
MRVPVYMQLLNSPPFRYSATAGKVRGGWGLYCLGRIVPPHQTPGACGDIFQGRFDYDNDGLND